MLDRPSDAKRPLLIGFALAAIGAAGWGSFAYVAHSAGQQVGALQAERDAAVAEHQALRAASGEMAQLETRLGAARTEYNRATQGLADLRIKIGAAQQELATLAKRADQGGDRVSQTGSLRQPEPPKRPVR